MNDRRHPSFDPLTTPSSIDCFLLLSNDSSSPPFSTQPFRSTYRLLFPFLSSQQPLSAKPQSSVDSSSAKPRPLFPNKNRALLPHPSPASFSFEDPKIRVPFYTSVHVTGLAVLSLNLASTCHCHRWRRRHYQPQRCLPSAHRSLAGDQVREDHSQKSHSITFIVDLAASLPRAAALAATTQLPLLFGADSPLHLCPQPPSSPTPLVCGHSRSPHWRTSLADNNIN
ncbi:hypothetical protein B296_00043746 [Ensete ventricosum]|uniref:Uncharacterized protein n=1 Tax=Ensete ventricosum TaxID=4639 RepID=A0A426X7F7_ENSVE|nr:hypothetical protein B296_00043746 [Ensete ventricosum]